MSSAARWVVIGANGMLGTELVDVLAGRDAGSVVSLDLPAIDITDPASVSAVLPAADVVVNCAAWTAVDDAETQEAKALRVNGDGARNLARACAAAGARFVQISTDYVFDGSSSSPYAEDATPNPMSAYGRTKLAGELAVQEELPDRSYILRTAWLYGQHGPNFISTMSRLETERETLDVVNDQHGQPTWARDLARQIVAVVEADAPAGIYHATASGQTTWFDLARRVFELVGADPLRVQPTTSEAFKRPAPRPANSTLSHDKWRSFGLEPLRDWSEALDDAWVTGGMAPTQPRPSR